MAKVDIKYWESWFKIDNYEKLNILDLNGWYDQLEIRRMMFSNNMFAKQMIDTIKENPIIYFEESFRKDSNDWWRDLDIRPYNTYSILSSPQLYKWSSRTFDKPNILTMDMNSALGIGYHGTDKRLAHITVDLVATDEQIKDDFSHWLTEYRKSIKYTSCEKKFTDKNISKWIKGRLLPYIDLKLVSVTEERKIRQCDIADLIFKDDGVDIVDRVKRTTPKNAKELISRESLAAIRAQLDSTI